MNPKLFKVAPGRTIWSNQLQKHFYEGEIVDLSHASDSEIAVVLLSGAIVAIEETPAPVVPEVKKSKKEK